MKSPSDEGVIKSGRGVVVCSKAAAPWVLAATILGSSMAFIDSTVVNVALPQMQTRLGGTVTDVQWVVEAYALFLSALILVGGSTGDLFGRRRVFVAGIVLFTAASVACAMAAGIGELIAARAIQGVGAAFLVPGSLAIISASFGEKDRGRAIGTWTSFTAITTAMGPALGGWLIEHWSWRAAFFINVPIGAAVIVLSMLHVPESKGAAESSVDWAGAFTVTGGLVGVTYGLIESSARGWGSASVWGTFAAGCALLACFWFVEARVRAPMVPLGVFRSSDFTGANLLTLFLYADLGIFFFLLPLNFIQVQHYSATATGLAILPFILLMFLLSRWSGGLVTRFGARAPLVVGPLIIAAGYLLFAAQSVGGSYWLTFFPALLVLGFGMAVSVAPLTTVVMGAVEEERAGVASGINNAVARVAGLLAVAAFGIVMVAAFTEQLNALISHANLPAEALRFVRENERRLADIAVPVGLDAKAADTLRKTVDAAFVFGFRVVMLVCAGLAVVGSGVAWRMVSAQVPRN